jgi:2'-5' RNA ligase
MSTESGNLIGIPLPETHLDDWRRLKADIHSQFPMLDVNLVPHPHIALFYPAPAPSKIPDHEITAAVARHFETLKGESLTVRGFGIFTEKDHPGVVWLGVDRSQKLVDFASHLPTGLPFMPHLTVARIDPLAAHDFMEREIAIQLLFNSVVWSFPVETVTVGR